MTCGLLSFFWPSYWTYRLYTIIVFMLWVVDWKEKKALLYLRERLKIIRLLPIWVWIFSCLELVDLVTGFTFWGCIDRFAVCESPIWLVSDTDGRLCRARVGSHAPLTESHPHPNLFQHFSPSIFHNSPHFRSLVDDIFLLSLSVHFHLAFIFDLLCFVV